MSLRRRYVKILSGIFPAGAVGVSLLLGLTVPGEAKEDPAGAQPAPAAPSTPQAKVEAAAQALAKNPRFKKLSPKYLQEVTESASFLRNQTNLHPGHWFTLTQKAAANRCAIKEEAHFGLAGWQRGYFSRVQICLKIPVGVRRPHAAHCAVPAARKPGSRDLPFHFSEAELA